MADVPPQQVNSALTILLAKVLHKWYFAAPTIHAVLGMTAELLGLYIVVVAGTNIVPTYLAFQTLEAVDAN